MFGERFHAAGDALRKPDGEQAKSGLIFFWSAARRGFSVGAQFTPKPFKHYGYCF
jgi:hypothetical protein